jgi:hypothetical protein
MASPVRSASRMSPRSTIGDDGVWEKRVVNLPEACLLPVANKYNVLKMPEDLLINVLSFIIHSSGIDSDSLSNVQSTCKKFQALVRSTPVWRSIPMFLADGGLNMDTLAFVKRRCQGTEGVCFQAYCRRTQKYLALKRARVYPDVSHAYHFVPFALTKWLFLPRTKASLTI